MFIYDYVIDSPFNIAALVLALSVMCVGSFTDLKKREVADWINYGFFFSAIAMRLLYSAWTLDVSPIVDGIAGFAVCTSFGLLMFYAGQWGGGDAKMIIGLGTLFGLDVFPFTIESLLASVLVIFLINTLFMGSIYGVAWSLFLALRRWLKFLTNWNRISRDYSRYRLMYLGLSLAVIITGLAVERLRILAIIGLFPILIFYSYIYTKSIERGFMVFSLPVSKVTEGDWIDKAVYARGKAGKTGKYICGPKDLGISKEQISLLQKYKITRVPVKIGIPFVPSFLLGFIVTMSFGNVILLMINAFI